MRDRAFWFASAASASLLATTLAFSTTKPTWALSSSTPTTLKAAAAAVGGEPQPRRTRTYQTAVDKHYRTHGTLPLPNTVHAVLSSPQEDALTNKKDRKNILVIGDVHGCLQELRLLHQKAIVANGHCEFEHVILVGDLCNKGPDSLGVLHHVMLNAPRWRAVRGNHDNAGLQAACGDVRRQEKPKYAWISGLQDEHVEFLSQLPYTLRIPRDTLGDVQDAVIVHAGLVPGVPLEQQTIEAMITLRQVQRERTSGHYVAHGKKHGRDDTVETATTPLYDEPIPWASVWKGPFHVIFGHDAKNGLQRYNKSTGNHDNIVTATGLDTGAVYGKQLTGMILPAQTLVSVDSLEVYCPIKEAKNG